MNQKGTFHQHGRSSPYIAALDLGSNTCRLLIAQPFEDTYKVIDSFSRVIRLGMGIHENGRLCDDAMKRAVDALKVCAKKLDKYDISYLRCVATEAVRKATNQKEFLDRIYFETGLHLEVIPEEEEARLALKGCTGLFDPKADYILGFDIGGCSTEVMWAKNGQENEGDFDWISIPFGVVNLIDASGGDPLEFYNEIRERIAREVSSISAFDDIAEALKTKRVQAIGSSGTTTTIGAIHLDLPYYDRTMVDGKQLPVKSLEEISQRLRGLNARDRADHPCIGHGRGEVVISGLAILQGISDSWDIESITVADRGVRDGILSDLLAKYQLESKSVA